MSTELGRIEKSGSRAVELSVTRYYGGDKHGPCLQLTAEMEEGPTGYVQLSPVDIVALLPVLKEHILDYALKAKLKEVENAISDNQELRHTIFEDIRAVSTMAIAEPVLNVAAMLSLGGKQIFIPNHDERVSHDSRTGGL